MQVWDYVKNPLRGRGLVVDMYWSKAVVQFESKAFWLKAVPQDILEVLPPIVSNREIAIEIAESESDFIPNPCK